MVKSGIVIVSLALVTACSSAGKTSSAQSISGELGCTPKPATVLGTTDAYDCGQLRVETFTSTAVRDQIAKAVAADGLAAPVVYVGKTVIECPDHATCVTVAKKVGGTVH